MIVVAGEALIDLVVQADGGVRAIPGGGPFNTARTIGRLGGEVAFLGSLSDDRFGRMLREGLIDEGVAILLPIPTRSPTTLAIAELDDEGIASYRFHTAETAATELTAEAAVAALATVPAAFHLGTLALVLEPIADALEAGLAAADARTLVMLDPNGRSSVLRDRAAYVARVERLMARADVVKLSTDDLALLAPGEAPAIAIQAILGRGAAVVLLTDGGRDVVVVTPHLTMAVPVPEVEVVDTVGAGDAFGGAFLARWTERGHGRRELGDPDELRDAVDFAVEVASVTCQRAGADPPHRDELARHPIDRRR